jgi:hypothetical protein
LSGIYKSLFGWCLYGHFILSGCVSASVRVDSCSSLTLLDWLALDLDKELVFVHI